MQEACLQVPQEEYNARVQDVVEQIPIKAANNTPLSELGMQPSVPTGAESPSPSEVTAGSLAAPPSAVIPRQSPQDDLSPSRVVQAGDLQDEVSAAASEILCKGFAAVVVGVTMALLFFVR